MFRRRFLQRLGFGGASGLVAMKGGAASERETVTYRVKGFSCATCAVGLETMLRQQRGILRAVASYEGAKVAIEFDPKMTTEQAVREYIHEMGFGVEEEHATPSPMREKLRV